MTYRFSLWLTNWFIEQGFLKQEDLEVYAYCIDSVLAKMVFYTVLLIVANIFHILPITIMYYLGFTPFRYTAGGFHAKTALRCSLL